MKISALIFFASFLCTSVIANTSDVEKKEKTVTQKLDISSILEEVFDNKTISNAGPDKKFKIIIMDSDFIKVGEESMDEAEGISNQSTLVPIIYQSDFIAKIHGVSYFMLQKK